jgi:hypothetical protein
MPGNKWTPVGYILETGYRDRMEAGYGQDGAGWRQI